jgi:hypothetical protein
MGPVDSPETSVSNHLMPRNEPDDRKTCNWTISECVLVINCICQWSLFVYVRGTTNATVRNVSVVLLRMTVNLCDLSVKFSSYRKKQHTVLSKCCRCYCKLRGVFLTPAVCTTSRLWLTDKAVLELRKI